MIPALDWQDEAACKGQIGLFFAPPGERPEGRVAREQRAGHVCNACRVSDECRAFAREGREYGFWGGESEALRAALGFPPARGDWIDRKRAKEAVA